MKRLNEKQWNAKIDIGSAMRTWEDNEDPSEFKQLLIDAIEGSLDNLANVLDADALYELETRVIEDLKMIDDDPDEIDYVLNSLYDWADDNNVWVETMN